MWKIFFYDDMWCLRLCELRIIQCVTWLWRLHDSGYQLLLNIWGFHSSEIEDSGLLGCYVEQWGYSPPTFWRNVLPPPSQVKKSAKYAWCRRKGKYVHPPVSWLVEIGKIDKPTVEMPHGMIVWALKRAIIQCAVWDFSSNKWGADL